MATRVQPIEHKATVSSGLLLAVVVVIAGLAAWAYQLNQGLRVTGLGQQVVWGAYIAAFFTAVGAGAGLLALVGLSEFRPLGVRRKTALALALGSFVAAALLITMDVGTPLQLWRVITAFRFSSLMTWDFWLLVVAGVVTLVYLLSAKDGQRQPLLGVLGLAASTGVVVVEGWMLSSLAARPLWGSGLTVVSFLVGAAIAGLGLAVLALPEAAGRLRGMLAGGLVVSLVLVLAEVLTGLLSGDARTAAEMQQLLNGGAAPLFWLHLLMGLVLPLMLLYAGQPAVAGALAVLGVLAEKVWLLAAGQAEPWLALPVGSYLPTWVELLAIAGAAAIGGLIYAGIRQVIPAEE